jgi:predicted peptidase
MIVEKQRLEIPDNIDIKRGPKMGPPNKFRQQQMVSQLKARWLLRKLKYPLADANEKAFIQTVDSFKKFKFTDPKTGITVNYNLYIPKDFKKTKNYPLVLFIHDAGAVGSDARLTLIQGLGAAIWATPSEQAKHECFVLAPQYSRVIVNDNSEATTDLDATVELVKVLQNQYPIDQNRLYTTGQSMGCMASIEMLIKYPDLFAAALLVAGQWDPNRMSGLTDANLWIIVSEGDTRAFPGMNASIASLEAVGAKISRAIWNGRASTDEFASNVQALINEGNNINYSVLARGTVVPEGLPENGPTNHVQTWPVAYNIEALRDWLFTQTKR